MLRHHASSRSKSVNHVSIHSSHFFYSFRTPVTVISVWATIVASSIQENSDRKRSESERSTFQGHDLTADTCHSCLENQGRRLPHGTCELKIRKFIEAKKVTFVSKIENGGRGAVYIGYCHDNSGSRIRSDGYSRWREKMVRLH